MKHNLRVVSAMSLRNIIYVINPYFKKSWTLSNLLLIYRYKYEFGIDKIRNSYFDYLEIVFITTSDLIDNMYNI